MSTILTELDRQAAGAVFRASLPRCGAQGRNDRLFLEALHHHLIITWHALPKRFGTWNGVWKWFERVEQRSRLRIHHASRHVSPIFPQCGLLISS